MIVLQKDGSLQGFEARSGALVWSMRLAELPRRLLLVGQRLAVFQRMGDQGSQGSPADRPGQRRDPPADPPGL